jgi:hypothetical protein
MAPIAGFFFFFGDYTGPGVDARDRPLAVFLWSSLIVMIGAILLATKGRKNHPKSAFVAFLSGAVRVLLAATLIVRMTS